MMTLAAYVTQFFLIVIVGNTASVSAPYSTPEKCVDDAIQATYYMEGTKDLRIFCASSLEIPPKPTDPKKSDAPRAAPLEPGMPFIPKPKRSDI